MVTFPSHSYEQYYQSVRRFWRFGQKRNVYVDIITTDGEAQVMNNIKRKSKDAENMFAELIKHMNDELKIKRNVCKKEKINMPSWL